MASPNQGSVDFPLTPFGGMVTQFDPQTLPVGASPFNQDVVFSGVNPNGTGIVGGWASRPGMGLGFYASAFAGNPTVNYIKTFIDSVGIYHELCVDGLGVVRDESPAPLVPGVPSIIGQVIAGSFVQSDALFNREFMAIGDGSFGLDIPRQWDSQYFDRVSQCGPGASPSAADGAAGNVSAGLHQISVAFITREQYITRPSPPINFTAGGTKKIDLTNIPTGPPNIIARIILVTPVITSPAITADFFYFDGDVPTPSLGTLPTMVINDNTTTSYTIDFTDAILQNTPVATNLFNMLELGECAQTTAYGDRTFWVGERNKLPNLLNTTFDGGFDTAATSTSTGVASPSVAYSKAGAEQPWSNPNNVFALDGVFASFNSDHIVGGLSNPLVVSGFGLAVPAGATITGVVFRVYVRASGTAPGGIFQDQAAYLTKDAANFVGGNQANNTAWSTVVSPQTYGSSLNLWGTTLTPAEVNSANFGLFFSASGNIATVGLQGLVDYVSVEVFYTTGSSGASPLGWTKGALFAGGNSAILLGLNPYWGDAYAIQGDGVTAEVGEINQSVYQDYLGVSILLPNKSYRVRVRLAQDGNVTAGTLHINLQSTSGAFTTVGLAVPYTSLSTSYVEFDTFLTDTPLAQIPTDILLQVYADGTPTNGGTFLVDCIEIYPADQPFNRTVIRASYAEQPEAFDELTGLLSINAGDGETVRLTFNILDNKLYIVKDRSMYVTQDDHSNEPDLWDIATVSNTVGTPSNRGVGIGESWAVIAGHDGAYIFWGSEPVKISQEIQPTWDRINWQYGYTIYVVVDTKNKRIHIGAPIDGATKPNAEFVCDYSELSTSEGSSSAADIASHPQAYYSPYDPTQVSSSPKARKWTIWNISMNCAALTTRSDGSQHLLRGNNTDTGKIYDQLPSNLNDDGAIITALMQTSYFPQSRDEISLGLGAHRKLLKYLTGYAFGSGVLNFFLYHQQNQNGVTLSSLTLKNPDHWDFEKNVNFISERMSLLMGVVTLNSWVQMVKLTGVIQKELLTPVRGNN